ncbi:MAG: YicC/YloC family endoribonuclease [Verrucomicrobiota bacterium JB022]|nr:YicC/YloC family endoribonuclease [Verrucomicrobiota bacterium JB022]
MQSMTGFGRGSATWEGLVINIELSSVNRRNLETSFNLPKEWQALERPLAAVIRERMQRGKIHTVLTVDAAEGQGALAWDADAVEATLQKLNKLAFKVGSKWPPDVDTLFRLVQQHRVDADLPKADEVEPCAMQALDRALEAINAMRATEGEALQRDLAERVDRLRACWSEIQTVCADTLPNYRQALLDRLRQAGLELDLQDERVLKEVAIFADRIDVTEELTRLDSHLDQIRETLYSAEKDGVIGRKLEFIVQEIHREFNTIGSKANNLAVTKQVIEAKNEIERIREQVQNVE